MEAMRCLNRRISDAVYRQLVADAERAALSGSPEMMGTAREGTVGRLKHPARSTYPCTLTLRPLPGPAEPTVLPPWPRLNNNAARSQPTAPARRSRQRGAPRTNDLDGDKRRAPLNGNGPRP